MDYVRTILNFPIPRILAWSSHASGTPVGAEFILMEKAGDATLRDRLKSRPDYGTMGPTIETLIELESRCLKAVFSQFGSLYYKEDVSPELQELELYAASSEIKEGADRFRIGPSVHPGFWRGQRASMNVDRGPCPYFF